MNALDPDPNVEKDRLKGAPGFDKTQWPDMADQTWAREIHSYYGTRPYPDEPRAQLELGAVASS